MKSQEFVDALQITEGIADGLGVRRLAESAWLVALAADRDQRLRREAPTSEDAMMASETLYNALQNFREAKQSIPHYNIYLATQWLLDVLQREKNDRIMKQLDALADIKRSYGL